MNRPSRINIQDIAVIDAFVWDDLEFHEAEKKAHVTHYVQSIDEFVANRPLVKRYYELAKEKKAQTIANQTTWAREDSIRALTTVVNSNIDDINRIHQEYSELEIELMEKIANTDNEKELKKLNEELSVLRRKRHSNNINNSGIVTAVDTLNKMCGFNEETVNLGGAVSFTDEKITD